MVGTEIHKILKQVTYGLAWPVNYRM